MPICGGGWPRLFFARHESRNFRTSVGNGAGPLRPKLRLLDIHAALGSDLAPSPVGAGQDRVLAGQLQKSADGDIDEHWFELSREAPALHLVSGRNLTA